MERVEKRELELLIVVFVGWLGSLSSAYFSLPRETLFSLVALGLVPDVWLWCSIVTTFLLGVLGVSNSSYLLAPSHQNRAVVAVVGLLLVVVLFLFPFAFVYVMLVSVASVGGLVGGYINWYRRTG